MILYNILFQMDSIQFQQIYVSNGLFFNNKKKKNDFEQIISLRTF